MKDELPQDGRRCKDVSAPITFVSERLRFTEVRASDADELFDSLSPSVSRFMAWDKPISKAEHCARLEAVSNAVEDDGHSFVIRRVDNDECLGMGGVEDLDTAAPEIGLWLKEAAHGRGYGTETVGAIVSWAAAYLNRRFFTYPVALDNVASRRIAERLGGTVVERRAGTKYDSVVYRVPAGRIDRVTRP